MLYIKTSCSVLTKTLASLLLMSAYVHAQPETHESRSETSLQDTKVSVYLNNMQHSSSKSVSVDYQIPDKLQPGQSTEIELLFSASSYARSATVNFTADKLSVLSQAGETELIFTGNEPVSRTLTVYSAQPVKGYLNIIMQIVLENDQVTGQALSIPIQFGSSDQIPVQQKPETSVIPGYHILPAKQTVK